ncbi:type IX secretion system membrane protein PorP/SprF [Nonlabens sp.]|uniref:PorP/SprF family type IX secretion system membrane protein n=1 Tax=Nonlabens sp. TaxID=1888209 RepID=UPI001BCFEA5B|nr:type IX secretion system membrane protein PorP/SprF [Nonlabens sp.]
MKRILVLFFSLNVGILAFGQQDAQFTNYMYNTMNINPAYAGSRGITSIFSMHRTQWVGLVGAPTTNTFSIHGPIRDTNLGMGVNVMNDAIGPSNESTISLDVSYTVPTSENFKLAFGLRSTVNLLNVDFTKLNIYNTGDALSQYNIDNRFSPNFGVGIYWYSSRTYIGLSVPNFLETSHFDKGQTSLGATSVAKERMHYHLMLGHVYDVDYWIQFKPAFLAKIVEGAPLQIDVSANFLFNEKFTLGMAYRWDASISLLAGFQVNDNMFIGYGYDSEVTNLVNYNSGSHELFLRYEFSRKKQVVSPRFF